MDRVKSKINTCGVDGVTESELIEMKYWTCIADAMTSYDYHFKIVEEMEKPENEYGKNYDENGRFYTPMRRKRYEEYDPSMRGDMEHYRDIDREDGRMYYTDTDHMGMSNGSMRSGSKFERAKRGYEDAKMMNPNADNMDEIEEMFKSFEEEIKELKPKMTTAEKTMARNRMTNIANMM